MDDALLVRRLERVGDLPRDRQRFIERKPALGDPLGERRPFDQLHDERRGPVRLFEPVDAADVRMIQRGERLRFTLKSRDAFGIGDERLGQDLDRDLAIELRVARAIHLAHPACPERVANLIRAEPCASGQRHWGAFYAIGSWRPPQWLASKGFDPGSLQISDSGAFVWQEREFSDFSPPPR